MLNDDKLTGSPREDWAQVSATLEAMGPQETLSWALNQFPQELVLASSFGAEDMVLVDMLCQLCKHPRIFSLDTGLLFDETYALMETVERQYHVTIERVVPEYTVVEQDRRYGKALYASQPDLCCQLRKVAPLQTYLQGKSAWITGLRRDQTAMRRLTAVVHWDPRHGLVKINPLANWSERDVFRYLLAHGVPYNRLHDQGYPSIGCRPCTQPISPGEDSRSGRWSGKEKTECGLHL